MTPGTLRFDEFSLPVRYLNPTRQLLKQDENHVRSIMKAFPIIKKS